MSRFQLLSDAQWSLIEELLPVRTGKKGRPFRDARQMVEGIIYRYRCGIAWRDVPAVFGPWQTIWTWHRRMSADGTWDAVLARLLSVAEAAGIIDWSVAVDSTIARAHQHATTVTRHPGQTRRIPAAPSATNCADAKSSRSSRNHLTRSPTASAAGQPADVSGIRRRRLQGSQRYRAGIQRSQAVARPGHPLRQTSRRLPRRRRSTRHHHLGSPIVRHALAEEHDHRFAADALRADSGLALAV
jgi:transposase